MSYNLGTVQSSTSATMMLNSSDTVKYLIAELQAQNNMREQEIDVASASTTDNNISTMTMGQAQAAATRFEAIGGITGGATSILTVVGTTGASLNMQAKADMANEQYNNVSTFKEALKTESYNGGIYAGGTVDDYNLISDKPIFESKNFLKNPNFEERSNMFNNMKEDPNYFKSAASEFADGPERIEANRIADDMLERLSGDARSYSGQADRLQNLGNSVSQALNGISSAGAKFASADQQVVQAMANTRKQTAEFSQQTAKMMMDALDSQLQTTQSMLSQLVQNLNTVAQAASAA